MSVAPYPHDEGPVFVCTRRGRRGTRCTWTGFPIESEPCPLDPIGGPHLYEPSNFDGLSFQPLWSYAERCGRWLIPAEFMAMGCRAWLIDGAPTVVFAYKYCSSRNYIHVDAHGYSAWTTGPRPEPVATARAVEHAIRMSHYHDDGCLVGSRVVILGRRRKAG